MNKKGFTLIELMVVISIIGILAAVGVVAFSKAQLSARDTRRKNDLREIVQGLSLYYQSNRRYPNNNDFGSINQTSVATGSDWNSALKTVFGPYINTMPTDPKNVWPYAYAYGYTNNSSGVATGYYLCGKLENSSDPSINVTPSSNCYVYVSQSLNFEIDSP